MKVIEKVLARRFVKKIIRTASIINGVNLGYVLHLGPEKKKKRKKYGHKGFLFGEIEKDE